MNLADAKAQLNIPPSNTTHDVELQTFVDAAIGAVERHTGQVGAVRTITGERHSANFSKRLWLHHRPVVSLTSVARVDASTVWDVAGIDVDADSGLLRVVTGPVFSGLLTVTYEAGYAVEPATFNLAGRIIVQHLWETQRGSAHAPVDADDVFDPRWSFAIPRRALELLGPSPPTVA